MRLSALTMWAGAALAAGLSGAVVHLASPPRTDLVPTIPPKLTPAWARSGTEVTESGIRVGRSPGPGVVQPTPARSEGDTVEEGPRGSTGPARPRRNGQFDEHQRSTGPLNSDREWSARELVRAACARFGLPPGHCEQEARRQQARRSGG